MRTLGLGVVLAVAFGGCSDIRTNTNLNPVGPPMITQVFVLELVTDPDTGIVRQDTQLAFGGHPDIDESDDGVVNTAVALGNQRIRIVVDELLRGNFLEQIACGLKSTHSLRLRVSGRDTLFGCAGRVAARRVS